MDCFQEMYYKLFNKITDVIGELEKVQQEAEELFLSYQAERPENILHIPRRDGEDPDKSPPKK